MEDTPPIISVVVAMHNEAAVIGAFFDRLLPALERLEKSFEVVCVDDGSSDETLAQLIRYGNADPRIRVISLSRNFGKEIAMTAGLDAIRGKAVVFIDADLQDPPELIESFVKYWEQGFENVYGTRIERASDSMLKRVTSSGFYNLFNRLSDTYIPPNAGDFRLLGSNAIEALRQCRERRRFMKGLYAWIGFPSVSVPYERQKRQAGTTKFNYWRLWNFAIEGISSHSSLPLRLFTYAGAACIVMILILAIWLLIGYLFWNNNPPGFYLTILVILFFSSVNILGLGLIGEYVGRIYDEIKQRPLYLKKELPRLE